MKITTTLVHNDKGTTKIVAKAAGKQRTINYDHGVSHDYNHGTAAGVLANVLGWQPDHDISHVTENGSVHRFTNTSL